VITIAAAIATNFCVAGKAAREDLGARLTHLGEQLPDRHRLVEPTQ
jgi:hypothetical protein